MPLAGHDAGGLLSAPIVEGNFNPRTPCGARPYAATWLSSKGWISIHVPLRGTTHIAHLAVGLAPISIHMPLAGHDIVRRIVKFPQRNFNPHAPCGARPDLTAGTSTLASFQSTCPLRGTTGTQEDPIPYVYDFNPRAPCGARPMRLSASTSPASFQSTCPLRGTTIWPSILASTNGISIHVPLAGHDDNDPGVSRRKSPFQSTCPLRGTTHAQLYLDD